MAKLRAIKGEFDGAGQGAGLAAEARLTPLWALLLMTPPALIGWLTHGPIFWVVWAKIYCIYVYSF